MTGSSVQVYEGDGFERLPVVRPSREQLAIKVLMEIRSACQKHKHIQIGTSRNIFLDGIPNGLRPSDCGGHYSDETIIKFILGKEMHVEKIRQCLCDVFDKLTSSKQILSANAMSRAIGCLNELYPP